LPFAFRFLVPFLLVRRFFLVTVLRSECGDISEGRGTVARAGRGQRLGEGKANALLGLGGEIANARRVLPPLARLALHPHAGVVGIVVTTEAPDLILLCACVRACARACVQESHAW
jgi:hypothetical protein